MQTRLLAVRTGDREHAVDLSDRCRELRSGFDAVRQVRLSFLAG